jgi:Uncharacterized protein conserved in bacteria (DUF2255)
MADSGPADAEAAFQSHRQLGVMVAVAGSCATETPPPKDQGGGPVKGTRRVDGANRRGGQMFGRHVRVRLWIVTLAGRISTFPRAPFLADFRTRGSSVPVINPANDIVSSRMQGAAHSRPLLAAGRTLMGTSAPRCTHHVTLAAVLIAAVVAESHRKPDGPINDRIDDAYRAKYARSPYLSPMISARARAATVQVIPR